MGFLEYIFRFSTFMPLYSALSCMILLLLVRRKIRDAKSVYYPLFGYFLSVSFVWITVSGFYHNPENGATWLAQHFTYAVALCVVVFFYHYVYNLTRRDGEKRFRWMHYAIPFLAFASSWFHEVSFQEITMVRFVFNLVYSVLGILRIRSYKQILTRNTFYDSTYSLSWVNTLIFVSFAMIVVALISNLFDFMYPDIKIHIFIILSSATITFQLYFLLVYTYRLNFEFLKTVKREPQLLEEDDEIVDEQETAVCDTPINKETFEEYMQLHKPYLDPHLKLTDLVIALKTNRSYLSSFINNTYGVNFTIYINTLRMEEFQRLSSACGNKVFNIQELIFQAGFTNYQQYLRTKKQMEE